MQKSWISAIKLDAYASWLGLTKKLVQHYLIVQEPTVLGHMNARKLGTQSSKLKLVGDNKFVNEVDINNDCIDPPKPGTL